MHTRVSVPAKGNKWKTGFAAALVVVSAGFRPREGE